MDALVNHLEQNVTLDNLRGEGFKGVLRFWLAAKGDLDLPLQSSIDPGKLPRNLLSHLTITGVEPGPKRFLIRLVGSATVRDLGTNATGKYVEDIPGAEGIVKRHTVCVERRRPYYCEGPAVWTPHDFRICSALAVPFAAPDGRVSRLLVYSEYS